MKKLPYFLGDSEIAILVCGLDLIKITGCETWLEEKINNLSMYLEMKEFYSNEETNS